MWTILLVNENCDRFAEEAAQNCWAVKTKSKLFLLSGEQLAVSVVKSRKRSGRRIIVRPDTDVNLSKSRFL